MGKPTTGMGDLGCWEDFPPLSRQFFLAISINFPSLPASSAAPSTVPIMHQVSATMRSITLSWPQPEQPNGIILDYEIRYYEKLSRICTPDVGSTVGSRPAPVSPGSPAVGAGLGARGQGQHQWALRQALLGMVR